MAIHSPRIRPQLFAKRTSAAPTAVDEHRENVGHCTVIRHHKCGIGPELGGLDTIKAAKLKHSTEWNADLRFKKP